MTSATHLIGTRWKHITRQSVENIAGCPMPGWDLCAASSIVMEIDSGQPMPNGNQPMVWLVPNETITPMVTIRDEFHIANYMQQRDILLNTNPREFSEMLGLPTSHQIMDSPLTLSRKHALARKSSIIVGTPIRLLSALAKRRPEWYRSTTVALLRLVTYHTHREYQFLTISTEERYLAFLQEYPHLVARMLRHEVAQYLDLTPVGLNHVVSRLCRHGAIPQSASRERAT